MSELLDRTQKAIRDCGLSQSQVARLIKVPRQRIYDLMRTDSIPTAERCEAVLEALGKLNAN